MNKIKMKKNTHTHVQLQYSLTALCGGNVPSSSGLHQRPPLSARLPRCKRMWPYVIWKYGQTTRKVCLGACAG